MLKDNIIPFLKKDDSPMNILIVEDDAQERMFMEGRIRDLGHTALSAENGHNALESLKLKKPVDVILMDRAMPIMDGITAVRHIKDIPDFRKIPIIMITGLSAPTDMQDGIDAGVFYYLSKPVNDGMLKSVLSAAIRETARNRMLQEELARHKSGFNLIETCKFRFRTMDDAELLAGFMAHCFPEPARVLPGLAELLFNAIEHGTYDIGYDRKSELIESDTLRAEIKRREGLAEYQNRWAEAVITCKEDGVYAIITDQGSGFPWKRYMTIEPARAKDNHGRGIAQANALSFDRLVYNEKGNQAIAFVRRETRLEW